MDWGTGGYPFETAFGHYFWEIKQVNLVLEVVQMVWIFVPHWLTVAMQPMAVTNHCFLPKQPS